MHDGTQIDSGNRLVGSDRRHKRARLLLLLMAAVLAAATLAPMAVLAG